jgi:hypothetical protein
VGDEVDWSLQRESIRKYNISQGPIDEVQSDPDRIEIRPAGGGGGTGVYRIVGYSQTARAVLTLSVVEVNGTVRGVNVDKANAEEIRRYQMENAQ